MSSIKSIDAWSIFDSRGQPTIACQVHLVNGLSAIASVPAGASVGSREAVALRDGGEVYGGLGVSKAIESIQAVIAPLLVGQDVTEQAVIDQAMIDADGTENKSRLGANAILAVSLAVARAAASAVGQPLYAYCAPPGVKMSLPVPMMNVINGGAHANNDLSIQEFMIVPHGFDTFEEAMRCGVTIFQTLKRQLNAKGYATTVGDEGGFAPNFKTEVEALDWLMAAIEDAGYQPGLQVSLALDIAASELYDAKRGYKLQGRYFKSRDDWIAVLSQWVDDYPIISIEDALDESDWEGWHQLTARLGDRVQLVGDDLFVTQTRYLQRGIDASVANSILIKPNQVGTLTEVQATIALAKRYGYRCVMSHRSGETADAFIADLAVATGVGQIKTGGLSRSDRMAKYNRLLAISHCARSAIGFYNID